MIELQQPYIPVCLMTAAVTGTEYYYHLYHIRRFREKVLFGRMGATGHALSDLYYGISAAASKAVYSNGWLKKLVLHGLVRPLGHVFRKKL